MEIKRRTGIQFLDRAIQKTSNFAGRVAENVTLNAGKIFLVKIFNNLTFMKKIGLTFKDFLNLWNAFTKKDLLSIIENPTSGLLKVAVIFAKLSITKSPYELHPYHPDGSQPLKPIFGLNYHATHYLGPGTLFKERNAMGQEGISYLDKVAKIHDKIYYESTRSLEDEKITQEQFNEIRLKADEMLKKEALKSLIHGKVFVDYILAVVVYLAMNFKIMNEIY